MKPVMIIVIAFVLLSSTIIPVMASYDCAKSYDLMQMTFEEHQTKTLDERELNPLQPQLVIIADEMIENRCGATISSWAYDSLYPERIREQDWEYQTHLNKVALGETEPTDEYEKEFLEGYNNRKSKNIEQTETENTSTKLSSNDIVCGTGTVEKNGQCVVDSNYKSTSKTSSRGGGCLIATATYGSELAPQVQQLRELRDNSLLTTESGTNFMNLFNDFYYSFSPVIADYERENPLFKEAVKLAITPMISTLSLMENAESESEVITLGLSVIALNLGMYLGVPAIVVMGIRKKI